MAVPLMFQPLVKYAQFEGRARRSEFWLWVLFRILVGIVGGVATLIFLAPFFSQIAAHQQPVDQAHILDTVSNIFRAYSVYMLISLGLLLPTLAVAVRRLHDTNRSGFWLLMPIGVIFGGMILVMIVIIITAVVIAAGHSGAHAPDARSIGAFIGVFLVYAVYFLAILTADVVLLIFFAIEGTRGPNRFGDDPKAPAARAAPLADPA